MRNYYGLPDIPSAGSLTRYADTLGVIVPLARTNLVTNPLLKNATTGWTALNANSIFQSGSAGDYFYGWGASLQPQGPLPGGGTQYGIYYTIALTAGVTYAVGMMFRRVAAGGAGGTYALAVATTGSVDLVVRRFTIPLGIWQWITLVWTETSSTSRRIIIRRDDLITGTEPLADFVRVSGLQVESCADGYIGPTTYIDGDQRGLVPNQYPPAYGWNGTPHASTSYRTSQTRAGGKVVRFRDLGFLLTAIIGLGMAPPAHQALTFAQLDGGQYQNTLKPPRQFSVTGRWATNEPNELDASVSQLGRLLDRDLVAQRQPLVLITQAQDCGTICGEPAQVQALYSGGLEGEVQELPSAAQSITFTNYLPVVAVGPGQGATLDVQDALTSVGGILYRAPGGTWTKMGTGTNGSVEAIVVAPSGLVYVGGIFTDAGGSGADYLAVWDTQTATWAVVKSATSIGNTVHALALAPNGNLYIGGAFINADGIAAADYIVTYSPTTNTFSALGTGMNDVVNALAVAPDGTLYATGNFTTAGGVAAARVAKWNGSTWSALGTGFASPGQALVIGLGGTLYAGGDFVNGGGVATADYIASWNGSAWSGLSTGMDNSVNALAVGPSGAVYAGGIFTTAGGVTAGGIAVWNGVGWQQLGSGFSSPGIDTPNGFAVQANGNLLIAASGSVIDPGTPGGTFQWNGSAYVDLGLVFGGDAIALAPDGTIYTSGGTTATAAGIATVPNYGTAEVYPRLTIVGPSSGTSRLYEIANVTTGRTIYLNLTLVAGETAVLALDPTNVSFISSFRGNVLSAILPGSQTTSFVLQPGNNVIGFFSANSTVTASLDWQRGYSNLNDALQVAVP